jgi:RHS repeat-associated protein
MLQPGRNYNAPSAKDYRYGFNGKENDNEVKGEGGQQDYGERIYDPRIGRFLSEDPLTKEYPELTPYQFASNRPIDGIDMDGLEWEAFTTTVLRETGGTTLRVVSKYGIETGAKVVAMKAAERVVESPRFWTWVGRGLVSAGGAIGGTLAGVFIPISTGGPKNFCPGCPSAIAQPNNLPKQEPNAKPSPKPQPAPTSDDDDDANRSKIFYATYTKTKVNPDGTTSTYSGRTSGTYTGIAPTPEEAQAAVTARDKRHVVLRSENYAAAILDEYSTSKAAIRGREQHLVDFHGGAQNEGGKSRNKIRAVRRNHPAKHIYNVAAVANFGLLPNNNPADKKPAGNAP